MISDKVPPSGDEDGLGMADRSTPLDAVQVVQVGTVLHCQLAQQEARSRVCADHVGGTGW